MAVDLSQFKSQLIYRDQATFSDIAVSIDQIKEFDKNHERRHQIGVAVSVLAFILCGIVIVIIAATKKLDLAPVAIVGGIGFVASLIYLRMSGKNNLPDKRYELTKELIDLLSRDMPKDARFTLGLDLAPANASRKKLRQDKVHGWDVTYFEDSWLQLEGRLCDGTSFEISVTERTQARKKWARSRSGKSKLKSKSKSATVVAVSLFPKQNKYANLGKMVDRTNDFLRLPKWAQVKKLVSNKDKLAVTAITNSDWTVRTLNPKVEFNGTELVVGCLLSLYQVLHASKAVSAN